MQFFARIKAPSSYFRSSLASAAAIAFAHAAMLPVAISSADAAASPDFVQPAGFPLFQATSLRFSTQKLAGLVQLAKHDASQELCSRAQDPHCAMWHVVLGHLSEADLHTRVRWINYAVNNLVTYEADHKIDDDWKSAADTLRSMAGDCEDYALLKMKLLAAAGVPASRMAVVVVEGDWINAHHAVLAVNLGSRMWILDNLLDDVVLDDAIHNYKPLYAFNSEDSWLYGTASNRGMSVEKKLVAQRDRR